MRSRLRLTLERDHDGTAELFVEASCDGFAGRASAWFNPDQIRGFATSLEQFPITADKIPLLEGGYWDKHARGKLKECHVSLRVSQLNQRGIIAVRVQLASPGYPDDRESPQHVSLAIRTDYASIQEFARALAALASGTRDEAVLESVMEAW